MSARKSRATKVIDEARHGLDEALLEASQLVDAFGQVAGEDMPPWLFTVSRHMDRLHEAAQAYMSAVQSHVHPLLNLVGPSSVSESLLPPPSSPGQDRIG